MQSVPPVSSMQQQTSCRLVELRCNLLVLLDQRQQGLGDNGARTTPMFPEVAGLYLVSQAQYKVVW
jgi:hypothetical protein